MRLLYVETTAGGMWERLCRAVLAGHRPAAVSPSAMKAMRATIRDLNLRRQTQVSARSCTSVLTSGIS
jgi:hypothetical protein